MNFRTQYRILIVALVSLISSLWTTNSLAAISNDFVAIDVAGSQRMLSQRIFKAYCLVVLDVKPEKYSSELNQAISRFEGQLEDLMAYAKTDRLRTEIQEVKTVWERLKPLITSTPDRLNIEEVKVQSDLLLYSANAAVKLMLQNGSSNSILQLIDVSTRQGMLTQRMANRYMMRALGFDPVSYKLELDSSSKEFKSALKELLSSRATTSGIKKRLNKVRTQYSLFEFSLKKKAGNDFPITIAEAADKMLNGMHEVTEMYISALQ